MHILKSLDDDVSGKQSQDKIKIMTLSFLDKYLFSSYASTLYITHRILHIM